MRRALAALGSVAVVAACGGEASPSTVTRPICDARELEEALGAAAEGHVVLVGACRIEGTFTVPPGVTVEGSGVDATTLAAVAARPPPRPPLDSGPLAV